jgi:ankyrin repeat protein
VKCQLDVLSKARTTRAIYDALENLPVGLDETYERILAKINEADVELAFRALAWVTCSARPLSVEELVEAIAIFPGQREIDEDLRLTDPGDIFDICGNLLYLTSETVGLAHYSVREFLTSERILSKPRSVSRFAISEGSGHRELANTCLTYLSFKDFDTGPCKNAESLRARLHAYPLLSYAARFWGWHSERGDIELDEGLLGDISKPGNNKLSNLLEVTSYQDRLIRTQNYEGRFYDDGNEGLLCTLVRFNFVSLAKKLLDRGADVNAQGGRYGNVLQLAANMSNASLVRLLLEKGANVNAAGGYFGNALQAASIDGDLETIKILLEWGADVNARGGGLLTALQGAALNGCDGAVRLFLEHGADVNIIGGYHGSALRAAALGGHLEIAKTLLQHGAAVNAHDDSGGSALEAASGSGNYELVKMLLEHGAEVNPQLPMRITRRRGYMSRTPLACAGFGGNEKVMRLLLDHGADVNAYGNETALAAVVRYGRSDLMEMLLAEGADINGSRNFSGNPLEIAMQCGQHELAQSLLKRGADPNGSGADWSTPLLEATINGSEKDIRLLVESGANINATGILSGSALHAAASFSDMETLQLLLDLGADVNIPGGTYGSPFLAAASHNRKDIVDLLLRLGACTTMPDLYGFNIGHYVKYGWCSLTENDGLPDWLGVIANQKNEVDLTKCKETIRASIEAIRLCTAGPHIFEILGRSFLIYGMEDDALTSLEQQIRQIGEEGIYTHPRCCDECKTMDIISGPRYVCKVCWDCDLCRLCYENVKRTHGKDSEDDHGFVEVPREGWRDLPEGIVNHDGESFEEWLGRLEERFRS